MEKIVLITGVSREMGLGFETARQLAELGCKVIITAREIDRASQLAVKLTAGNLNVTARQLGIIALFASERVGVWGRCPQEGVLPLNKS